MINLRHMCFLLFVLSALTLGYACKKASRSATVLSAKSDDGALVRLRTLHKQTTMWSLRCGASVSKERCDVGDAALFNGLLCLSGDQLSCEAVRRSQGSDGRMWRSEIRVAADAVNSFSRDMAMGVLAYLVATKDVSLASRWMTWIESNNWRLCRESSDNRCDFSPGFWSLFRDVWQYLRLPLNQQMDTAILDDSLLALLQSQFAPEGYELHLSAVNLLIRKSMGQKSTTLDALARALTTRQNLNPFFAYLSEGGTPRTQENLFQWCPDTAPYERTEWSFERTEGDLPWERSMGWECLMLMNFILRDVTANSEIRDAESLNPL